MTSHTSPATALTITGYHATTPGMTMAERLPLLDQPTHAEAHSGDFDTQAEAEAFLATLPKSLKLRVITGYGIDCPPVYYLRGSAILQPTKGNPVNETGVRRVRAWLKAGATYEPARNCSNTYPTLEALLDGIDAQAQAVQA